MSTTQLASSAPSASSSALPPPNLIFPSSMRSRKRRPAFITHTIQPIHAPAFDEVDPNTECNRPPCASEFLKSSFFEDTQASNPYASTAPGAAWSDKKKNKPRTKGLTKLVMHAYGSLDTGLDPTDGKAALGAGGKRFVNVIAHRGDEVLDTDADATDGDGDAQAAEDESSTNEAFFPGPEIRIVLSSPPGTPSFVPDKKPALLNPTALSPMDANRDKWGVVLDKDGQVVQATEEEKMADGWLKGKVALRDGWKSDRMAESRRKQGKATALEQLMVSMRRW